MKLLIIALLILCSALISGSEVAFFSLTANDLKKCEEDNSKSSSLILKLLGKPKRLLATILIANNLVNVAIVTISTYMSWELAGTSSEEHIIVLAMPIIVTIILVFLGEVLPKTYASQKGLYFSQLMAFPLKIADKILYPLSFVLMSVTDLIERRFEGKGYNFSVDEINKAIEAAVESDEEATDEETEILKGIVTFGTKSVRQVMHSRMDITAFSNDIDFHQLMDKINKCGYSRIPIYHDTIDSIEGILYVKDLLPFIDNEEGFTWQKLVRPAYYVPESKKIDDLLKSFQEKRVHVAMVVDEYGGTSGLVTLEDIIEEIVGEINDEFDELEVDYSQISEHEYLFEGKTSLNDFAKVLEISSDYFDDAKGESESIGGLLLELNSSMPNVGEEISYEDFTFKIEAVSSKRIKKIKVTFHEDIAGEFED